MRGLFPKAVVILMALALSACVALAPAKGKPDQDNPVTGGQIEVTPLDTPTAKDGKAPKKSVTKAPAKGDQPVLSADAAGVSALPSPDAPKTRPKPRPEPQPEPQPEPDPGKAVGAETVESPEAADTPPPPEAAEAQPGAEKSPSQLTCEKKGNIWAKVGETGANYCAKRTRDNGKRCTKATECEGLCLARSGTCAPFNPLFGCNEILQDDGSRVTQCIN